MPALDRPRDARLRFPSSHVDPNVDLALVPLTLAHAEAMFRWMCDPVIAKNLGLRSEPSLDKSRAYVERADADDSIEARAILLGGLHVGNVVLDQIDRVKATAHLHIYIGESSARGTGAGKRALRQALTLAFSTLQLNKVWLTVHARNAPAIAAYVAVGFQVEGVHREEFLLDGERVAELYMGCLAADFAKPSGPP
jgi:RimJ/RimL family protein N-acetyltransferase